MSKYAEGTQVPVSRSREEIERTLERFGATAQMWMRDDEVGAVTVAFKRDGKMYKFSLRLPPLSAFKETPSHKWIRTAAAAKAAQDTETRRCFRSLANYLKAMLDAIDTGIIVAEEALLPYLMLPGGHTVYEQAQRQLRDIGDVNFALALPTPKEM